MTPTLTILAGFVAGTLPVLVTTVFARRRTRIEGTDVMSQTAERLVAIADGTIVALQRRVEEAAAEAADARLLAEEARDAERRCLLRLADLSSQVAALANRVVELEARG